MSHYHLHLTPKTVPGLLAMLLGVVMINPSDALAQTTADLAALRLHSLSLVNEARAAEGLDALSLQDSANAAALAHAQNMLENNFYDHVAPDGETVLDRYLQADGTESHVVLENIARCQGCSVPADEAAVARLHEGWMESPGHRENILTGGISGYGFALAEDQTGTRLSVQVFAGAGMPRELAAGAEPVRLTTQEQAALAAEIVNETRIEDGIAALTANPQLVTGAEAIVSSVDLDQQGGGGDIDIAAALPSGAPWRQVQLLMGNCTGCGTEPTAADVRFFVGQWLESEAYRELLLSGELTALGMTIQADGEGLKTAVLMLGAR